MSGPVPRERPTVGAVVVNFNGGERTLRCLEALERQSVTLERIVVVDNGSQDGGPAAIRLRFPRVEVIELGDNRGLPGARNVGLRALTSGLALLLDHDLYLETEAVERMVQAWTETRATVVCPRIRLLPERDVVQADGAATHFVGTMILRHGYRSVDEVPGRRARVAGCIGACYLLDRRRVLDAGGFDETYFFYFEDLEFMLRLGAAGHEFVCEPSALAFHDRGAGTAGLSFRGTGEYPRRRAYLSMRHRLLTILIHYRARTLLVLLPALALYELATAAFAVTRGWGLAWLRAWTWQLAHLGVILRRRRAVGKARLRPDRELLAGGPLPLAPGVVREPLAIAAVETLSSVLDAYWRLARRLVG